MKTFTYILIIALLLFGAWFFLMRSDESKVVDVIEEPAVIVEQADESEIVENYLRANIGTLSPVVPVLGGNWYVVSMTIDLESNSGMVVYEDGHIQEERSFTYDLNEKGEVSNLTLQ
jgi:hypothetical protein